ncbi:MAG: hypothetical protein KC502_15240 [Myxococcales bacterium]|nr:hypothetical protein [Myxococcales bacterium]
MTARARLSRLSLATLVVASSLAASVAAAPTGKSASPAKSAPAPKAKATAPAEEAGYGDDDESGFGDDGAGDDAGFATAPAEATPVVAPPSPWSLVGAIRSDWGMWTERVNGTKATDGLALQGGDDNPFAKGRQNLDLTLGYKRGPWRIQAAVHGEFDLAYLHRADEFRDPTRDAYRQLLQVRETFAALALGDFEFTVGRQVVAWGEGDGMSVVDVVNPRDNREPGLSDLDDIRVPVLASRVGWFTTTANGDHRVEAMVVHETCNTLWREACFGLRTPPLGPFSPLPAFLGGDQAPAGAGVDIGSVMASKEVRFEHGQTDLAWANQQWLLRWVYKGAGIDLGAYAASVLDQQGVITNVNFLSLLDASKTTLVMPVQHLRYELVGTSGAMATGDFLLKWELALEHRRPFSVGDSGVMPPKLSYQRTDTLQTMVSVTYRGIRDTVLGFEGSRTTLLDTPEDLLFPVDAPFLSLRAQHNTWNDRLHFTAVAIAVGHVAQYGWLARADVTWDIRDALKLSTTFVTYQPGEKFGPFAGLDQHDRIGVRLRWDFSAL